MYLLISWRKGFFSNTYQFNSNGMQVGFLKLKSWSQKANGKLNDKEYDFKTAGFFKKETIITETSTNSIIGVVSYNLWKSKAMLKLSNNQEYQWQYTNFWHSKWSVSSSNWFVNYHGSSIKGEINANTSDEMLILAGFYISNFFWQSRAGAIAAT